MQVLPATRNAARRYKAELTLLIHGVTQPDAVISALQTAEQRFADRLVADGIDLAENGTRVVSDPFMVGTDVAIYADLGDAPGAIVDRWVHLIAELAAVDPGVTEVRLPRRRSRIAALFMDTQMYSITPASWTGQAPTSWLIAAAQWLADIPSARYVAWVNGSEFDVERDRLAEQLAAAMTTGSAVVAFDRGAMVRFVHCRDGQLDFSMPSPPIGDDAGWASATGELTRAGLALRPRPAWACLFTDLSWSPMLPDLRPGVPGHVPVYECLRDPRWGLPDAYPVVLLRPEWAAACGISPSGRGSADDLIRVDVVDPRALIPLSYDVEIPRTVDPETAVRYARERLAALRQDEAFQDLFPPD